MQSEDRVRLLARSSPIGYVEHAARALKAEPEAVSEDEQRRQTEQAAQRRLDERIRRREATAGEVEREVEHLEGRLRYLKRQLRRLAR